MDPFNLQEYTKPGVSRSSKGQTSQNNFIKRQTREFQIQNQEIEAKIRQDRRKAGILEVISKPKYDRKEPQKQKVKTDRGTLCQELDGDDDKKEADQSMKKSLEAIQKLRDKDQAVKEKRERIRIEQEASLTRDTQPVSLFNPLSPTQNGPMSVDENLVQDLHQAPNPQLISTYSKVSAGKSPVPASLTESFRDNSKLVSPVQSDLKKPIKVAPPPQQPVSKKITRDQEIEALRHSMELQREQANKLLKENKQKMAERMGQIVGGCRYEETETMKTKSGEESEQVLKKVDFTKFRREVVSLNMNEGIKVNIKEARIKKETAKIEKELESHYIKMRKKPVKQKKIGGLSVEEIHERQRKYKREQQEARRRHLKRANAGIDKSQIQPESIIFKTVSRDQACNLYEKLPQGTEVGRYDPVKQDLERQPCYVRIQNDKCDLPADCPKNLAKQIKQKNKEPSVKYAKSARCTEFVPNFQHDEIPKVNCHKLHQRLKQVREMIYSESKESLLKEARQNSMSKLNHPSIKIEEDLAGDSIGTNGIQLTCSLDKSMDSRCDSLDQNLEQIPLKKNLSKSPRKLAQGSASVDNMDAVLPMPINISKPRFGGSQNFTPMPMHEASLKLKQIYDRKDLLEKQYGRPVQKMSPINHINYQYEQLLTRSIDSCTSPSVLIETARSRQINLDEIGQRSAEKSVSPRGSSKKKLKGKVSKMLENLHKPVSKVSMMGMNSNDQYTIDFVASPSGVSQIYKGQQPACGSKGAQSHLPAINFDKQTKRKNEFLKLNDDAHHQRFTMFNQFPKCSTKANFESPRGVPDFTKGALRTCKFDELAKPKFSCHHYMHDPNFSITREKSNGGLVPFEFQNGFNRSVALTSLNPSTPKKQRRDTNNSKVSDSQHRSMQNPYSKYHQRFKSSYQDKLKCELEKTLAAATGAAARNSSDLRELGQISLPNEVENPSDYFRPKMKLNQAQKGKQVGLSHFFILNE